MKTVRRALLAVGALLAFLPVGVSAQVPASRTPSGPPPVTAQDRIIGRADAPVTLIEYASFTCPHCADWHLFVLPQFKARYIDTGQVRLVFRNLPTQPSELSMPAAGLARCARPERFAEVAGVLMQGQHLVLSGAPREEWFDAAVAVSGRSRAEIDACLARPATRAAINADLEGAEAAGVTGTPTFFLNDQRVRDRSLGGLEAALRPLLAGD